MHETLGWFGSWLPETHGSGDGRDGDGHDLRLGAVEIGVAGGAAAHGGQRVIAQMIGQRAEPPACDHHVGG